MILAEKIMSLRKQKGWSQEELAAELNVSRQSVSKWESAASMPDIQKIMKMSEIFGVSTDYLLRDEIDDYNQHSSFEKSDFTHTDNSDSKHRRFSLDEANDYIQLVTTMSAKIAAGAMLCVLSPIMLRGLSEEKNTFITEKIAGSVGVTALLMIIAIAVVLFILAGNKLSKYDFVEEEVLDLDYGVEAAMRRKRDPFIEASGTKIAVGVALCVLGVVPLMIIGTLFDDNSFYGGVAIGVMLFLISIAVFIFVKIGMIKDAYKKVLQEENFTPENKITTKKTSWFSGVYWLSVVAIYLGYSFITGKWYISWVIWPVAGVLSGVIYTLLRLFTGKKNKVIYL